MTTTTTPSDTTFLSVALAARERGFTWIVPLDDKAPLRNKWLKFNVTRTESELRLMAADFPAKDVGIVLKGHAGTIFVWDIDKEGVIERMERENPGRTLPVTYIVQSRPEIARHKMHVYFRQTAYFASLFPKQVNAGDYDLKGMGGGQVVAEGCIRKDTGEIRKGNGQEIVEIPDWLTDWIKRDSAPLVAAISAKKREAAKTSGGTVIAGQRSMFLKTKAAKLFEDGYDREYILTGITKRCREDCQDGVAWAASDAGKKKLRSIAYTATFRKKRINPVYTAAHPQNQRLLIIRRQTPDLQRKENFQALVEKCRTLPRPITAGDAYKRLELNPSLRADQNRMARAMRKAKFQFKPGRRGEGAYQ